MTDFMHGAKYDTKTRHRAAKILATGVGHRALATQLGIPEATARQWSRAYAVGGLGGGPERKVVFQNITLDDADAEILEYLAGDGMDIIFQTIPEDAPQKVDSILKKYRA